MSQRHLDALKAAGLTSAQLAEQIGMSRRGVDYCVKNDRYPHNRLVAQAYATVLRLPDPADKGPSSER